MKKERLHNIVYKRTNKINGMFYIGAHSTDDLNDGYMGSGKRFKYALKKYGIDNFKSEILHDVENAELMFFIEQLIVDEEFLKRKDVYNIYPGGTGGCPSGENHPLFGKKHTEESKKKMSEAANGRKLLEETKKKISVGNKGLIKKPCSIETKSKISNSNKGKIPWNKGIPHSSESIKKMSDRKKGKKASLETKRKMSDIRKGSNNPRARKIICITTGEIFNSVKDASIFMKLNSGNICACCKEKLNYTGALPDGTKLVWRYADV